MIEDITKTTPKDKAQEIFNVYMEMMKPKTEMARKYYYPIAINSSDKCVNIMIDNGTDLEYWKEVKLELENL